MRSDDDGDPKIVNLTAEYSSDCLSCEEPIRIGDPIRWCPGVGAWHTDCREPRSLRTLWKDAQKKKALGW